MAKKKNNIMKPNQSIAKVKSIRISTRKLGLLAGLIRNMKADQAIAQLSFSKKKVAKDVKMCLNAAIANAENNDNLNIDRLYIAKVLVGKAFTMKRMMARAKGRGCRILKQFSRLTIIVEER
ncbi:MAG: 50S ribosomal protein L22 [Rickettsiales bacterium]|nr:50S ribosomal protein L22 [Rickettsiales bacterium]